MTTSIGQGRPMLTYPGPGGRDRWSLPNACREPCYGLFAAATDHSRRRGLKEAGCWRWLCACGYKRCSSSYRRSGCAGRPQAQHNTRRTTVRHGIEYGYGYVGSTLKSRSAIRACGPLRRAKTRWLPTKRSKARPWRPNNMRTRIPDNSLTSFPALASLSCT